eukprot:246430_1
METWQDRIKGIRKSVRDKYKKDDRAKALWTEIMKFNQYGTYTSLRKDPNKQTKEKKEVSYRIGTKATHHILDSRCIKKEMATIIPSNCNLTFEFPKYVDNVATFDLSQYHKLGTVNLSERFEHKVSQMKECIDGDNYSSDLCIKVRQNTDHFWCKMLNKNKSKSALRIAMGVENSQYIMRYRPSILIHHSTNDVVMILSGTNVGVGFCNFDPNTSIKGHKMLHFEDEYMDQYQITFYGKKGITLWDIQIRCTVKSKHPSQPDTTTMLFDGHVQYTHQTKCNKKCTQSASNEHNHHKKHSKRKKPRNQRSSPSNNANPKLNAQRMNRNNHPMKKTNDMTKRRTSKFAKKSKSPVYLDPTRVCKQYVFGCTVQPSKFDPELVCGIELVILVGFDEQDVKFDDMMRLKESRYGEWKDVYLIVACNDPNYPPLKIGDKVFALHPNRKHTSTPVYHRAQIRAKQNHRLMIDFLDGSEPCTNIETVPFTNVQTANPLITISQTLVPQDHVPTVIRRICVIGTAAHDNAMHDYRRKMQQLKNNKKKSNTHPTQDASDQHQFLIAYSRQYPQIGFQYICNSKGEKDKKFTCKCKDVNSIRHCDRQFGEKCHWMRHCLETHVSKELSRRFKCPYCAANATFTRWTSVLRHCRKQHSEREEPKKNTTNNNHKDNTKEKKKKKKKKPKRKKNKSDKQEMDESGNSNSDGTDGDSDSDED